MTITEQEPRTAPAARRSAPGPVRDAVVRAMRLEAEGVLSMELELADGEAWPDWEAGAHLDVVLGPGLVRQYSLCSRPGEPWRVAVLREPASRGGSEFVHSALRPGAVIGIRGPRNNFTLQPARSYRFLAGGIGITPILSMVRHAEALGVPWTLDYLGRSRTSMAFQSELAEFGDRVRVHADDTDGLFDLAPHLAAPDDGALAYACGPGGLLGVLLKSAASWPEPEALQVERFVAERAPADDAVDAASASAADAAAAASAAVAPAVAVSAVAAPAVAVSAVAAPAATPDTAVPAALPAASAEPEARDAAPGVVHDASGGPATASAAAGSPEAGSTVAGSFVVELNDGAEIEVPAERSILETLEDHGYAPLSSCREGICGTCETGVISGEVEHRDTLLSDEEKAASETMMICVSRACGGCRLKLDL